MLISHRVSFKEGGNPKEEEARGKREGRARLVCKSEKFHPREEEEEESREEERGGGKDQCRPCSIVRPLPQKEIGVPAALPPFFFFASIRCHGRNQCPGEKGGERREGEKKKKAKKFLSPRFYFFLFDLENSERRG